MSASTNESLRRNHDNLSAHCRLFIKRTHDVLHKGTLDSTASIGFIAHSLVGGDLKNSGGSIPEKVALFRGLINITVNMTTISNQGSSKKASPWSFMLYFF